MQINLFAPMDSICNSGGIDPDIFRRDDQTARIYTIFYRSNTNAV